MLRKNASWWLPILSGIFIGTSYIPFPPWASLFCCIPLWIYWSQQTKLKSVLCSGILCAFIFTLIGFNWVTYLLHEFAHLPWAVAFIGMLIFALLAHLFVPVAGILWFLLQRRLQCSERLSIALMAIITSLCEFYSLTLFDWNFGYSWFASSIPIYQWAEVIGFSGLSSLTLLCNLPLYYAWKYRDQTRGKIYLATVIMAFIALNLGGSWLEYRLPKPDASVNALLVQANIGNEQKIAAELGRGFRQGIIDRYQNITISGLNLHAQESIDFILWPETAYPFLLGENFKQQQYHQQFSAFIKHHQTPLITGAYSLDSKTGLLSNSLFVINRQGEIIGPHYSKSILLAFGEYIPGEESFPQIREWLPATGHFARGPGPTKLLKLNDYRMGPQICYESLFPKFARSLANLGAQFIVNVTNDSWYGKWQEPYQHLYMTLARSIEFRRPLLRATNTGISTAVLASGEILERSPLHQEWSGLYKIPYLKNPLTTFYQRWFWLIPILLFTSLLIIILLACFRNKD